MHLKNSKKQELFEKWKEKVNYIINNPYPKIIQWEATRNCNLNCAHCGSPEETWNPNKEIETSEVINAFKNIADYFNPKKIDFITITGGEPFLRDDLFEILTEFKRIGFENITIQTNGIFLFDNIDLVEKLFTLNVKGLGFNLDGLEDTHNQIRNKKAHFEKTIKLIKSIKSKFAKSIYITISTIVTPLSLHQLAKLSNIVDRLNIDRWRVIEMNPLGRGVNAKEYSLNPEEYIKMVNFIKNTRVKWTNELNKPLVEMSCGGWLGIQLEGVVRPYIWHCTAGINTLGILYDGGISACSNISRKYIQGNIKKDNIPAIWNNRYEKFRDFGWKRKGICEECDQWEFCHGGAMHLRSSEGKLLFCSYKTYYNNLDFWEELPNDELTNIYGN